MVVTDRPTPHFLDTFKTLLKLKYFANKKISNSVFFHNHSFFLSFFNISFSSLFYLPLCIPSFLSQIYFFFYYFTLFFFLKFTDYFFSFSFLFNFIFLYTIEIRTATLKETEIKYISKIWRKHSYYILALWLFLSKTYLY